MSYEDLPKAIQDLLSKHCIDGSSYEQCELIIDQLRNIGWTAEYGLDGEIDLDSIKPIAN